MTSWLATGQTTRVARRRSWTVADLTHSRLAGQVVLISGAESGIGRETALRGERGADIAAVGLDSSGLDSLVEQVRAMGRRSGQAG